MDKKEKNSRLKQHLARKAGVLVLLFLAVAAASFFFLRETKSVAAATELSDPTLPTVRAVLDAGQTELYVNEMHGYVEEMDILSMRETMTPVGEDGLLTFEADTYGATVTGATYEIYSSEGYNVVASGSAAAFEADTANGIVTFRIEVPESLSDGEYALRVILATVTAEESSEESGANGEEDKEGSAGDADSNTNSTAAAEESADDADTIQVNYYTTLKKGSLPDYATQIAFIETFHENTFLASGETMMEQYFTASTTTTDYGEITLSDTAAAAMWGDLAAAQIGEAEIDILDFSEGTIGSYRISFVVETESDGALTYYHAEECFTVSGDGTTVLSYQRTLDEVFSPSSTNLTASRINLGIQSENETEYMVKSGRIAFVNHGALYLMYMSGYEITEVFSFTGQSITSDSSDGDLRACYHEYDIRIISLDSDGNMKFMVYGYMNSGLHEGQVGIALYSYDSETLTTTEEIFLAYDKSYEYLKEVIGKIAYINSDGSFYLMIEDSLYYMDFIGRESVLMTDGLIDFSYVISDDGDVVAWNEGGDVYNATSIRLVDLEEAGDIFVSAEEGKTIRALGFIGTDFLYAISTEENLTTDDYGNTVYAAETIVILDEEGNEKRRIEKEGFYLTDITITDNMISFEYSEKSLNDEGEIRFTAVGEDQVIGQVTSTTSSTRFSHVTDDVKGRCLVLAYGSTYTFSNDLVTQKSTVYNKEDDERKISTALHGEQYYYAYGRGNLLGMYDSAAEAVEAASEVYGYVIDSGGTVVYRRGEKQYYMYLLEVTVSDGEAILEAYTAGTALDLSGASLSILLEYVGQRVPVLVNTPNGWAIIVDYDSTLVGIRYLDTNKKVELEKADAEALFEEGGNVFVVIP